MAFPVLDIVRQLWYRFSPAPGHLWELIYMEPGADGSKDQQDRPRA